MVNFNKKAQSNLLSYYYHRTSRLFKLTKPFPRNLIDKIKTIKHDEFIIESLLKLSKLSQRVINLLGIKKYYKINRKPS